MPSPLETTADIISKAGLHLRREWLHSCLARVPQGQQDLPQIVLQAVLDVDLRRCAEGSLPPNVATLHKVVLAGPFFLQLDECVNIGASADNRHCDVGGPNGRLLKLALTDGVQLVFGLEHSHVRELSACSPAGCKLIARNVEVRRGMLLLRPEGVKVIGGRVDNLVALQQAVYGSAAGGPAPSSAALGAAMEAAEQQQASMGAGAIGAPSQGQGQRSQSAPSPLPTSSPGDAISPSSMGRPSQGARHSTGSGRSGPPLRSPVLTQDVALITEVLDSDDEAAVMGSGNSNSGRGAAVVLHYDVDGNDGDEPEAAEAELASAGERVEDGRIEEEADPEGSSSSLADLIRLVASISAVGVGAGVADSARLVKLSLCSVGKLTGFTFGVQAGSQEHVYAMRCFLCDPAYAEELESVSGGRDALPVEAFDTSRGLWAGMNSEIIQKFMEGRPAAVTAQLLDKASPAYTREGKKVIHECVDNMNDYLLSYRGSIHVECRWAVPGGEAVILECPDAVFPPVRT